MATVSGNEYEYLVSWLFGVNHNVYPMVSGYQCGYSQGDRTYLARDLNVTTS